MTKDNKLIDGIFKGITINTPSMLCVEDLLACYRWIKKIGGRSALQKRSYKNLEVVSNWVEKHDWVEFLASNEKNRSSTAMCLTLKDSELVNPLCELLEQKKLPMIFAHIVMHPREFVFGVGQQLNLRILRF